MDERHIETIRAALDAVSRRDLDGVLAFLDPDVELRPRFSVWRQTYRGHEGIEEWWNDMTALWDEFTLEVHELSEVGDDTLVVTLDWRGRDTHTKREIEGPGAAVVRFHQGKVAALDMHLDAQRAMAALKADRPRQE
jgi:ketosteroid isomerase-like protein